MLLPPLKQSFTLDVSSNCIASNQLHQIKFQRNRQCFKKANTKSYDISQLYHVHLYDILVINIFRHGLV